MAEIIVKKKTEDANEFQFTGVIIGRRESTNAMTVFVRMNTRQGAKIYTNTPSVSVFDNELRKKVNALPLRVPVNISGYVTSSKERRDEHGNVVPNRYPPQSFVMTGIELAKDEPVVEMNKITIVGNVEMAYVTRSGMVNFIITTVREGHYLKRIKVVAFPKENVDYFEFMRIGSRVRIQGHCSTRSIDTEEGPRYFESIILDNIAKV